MQPGQAASTGWRKWMGGVAKETSFVVLGAIIGGIVSQFTLPALAPYAELYAFKAFGINVSNPNFVVLASEDEIKARTSKPGDLLTISRQFCGWSSYCLQIPVKPADNQLPSQWAVVGETKEAMDLLVSKQDGELNAAFVSKHSKVPGFYRLRNIAAAGYLGFGYGCYQMGEDPKEILGRYPVYWGPLDAIYTKLKSTNPPHNDNFAMFDAEFYERFYLVVPKNAPKPPVTSCGGGVPASS